MQVESADDAAAKVAQAGGEVIGEPFDSPGGGRMAVLADPAGAVFCVWEPRDHKGAQRVNEPGAWAMSQLTTNDPEGAKEFYGAVFGWETDSFDMGEINVTLWRVPGYVGGEPEQPVSREVVGAMVPSNGDGGAPPSWGVDFWVHDADAIAAKAAELGGRVVAGPFDMPSFRRAVIVDPQGAELSISQLVVGP
jgi:predicted enzyme related to lactoylglutathione lyase